MTIFITSKSSQAQSRDAVYVKDFVIAQSLTDEQIKQMSLIAHHCYWSHDLVMRCLSILSSRNVIEESALKHYRQHVFPRQNVFGEFKISDPIGFDLN